MSASTNIHTNTSANSAGSGANSGLSSSAGQTIANAATATGAAPSLCALAYTVATYDGREQTALDTTNAKVAAVAVAAASVFRAPPSNAAVSVSEQLLAMSEHPPDTDLNPNPRISSPRITLSHSHGRFEITYACAISGPPEAVAHARTIMLIRNPTLVCASKLIVCR
ncbi:hypothetical protein HK100_007939 [Physocladia obscura]|uniref:Uncharacterized protein n=1 Tax=Physocladia obscura TaxID=109957 RepID=A0AAD5XAU6_9FUNG|nr:hypothetical protein HK100_007939 [Physocladia obscura]